MKIMSYNEVEDQDYFKKEIIKFWLVLIFLSIIFIFFIHLAFGDEGVNKKDINIKSVTVEETSDCKSLPSWEPVYNSEGRIIGHIVRSNC